jgi:hypothetical protein
MSWLQVELENSAIDMIVDRRQLRERLTWLPTLLLNRPPAGS